MPRTIPDRDSRFVVLAQFFARRSVPLSPEQIAPAEGLRAAFATVAALVPALYWHDTTLIWMSFTAFWSCLLEPGGTRGEGIRVLGLMTVIGSILSALTALIAALPAWIVLLWLALTGAAVGLGWAFSASTALLCAVLGCTVAAGVGFPAHESRAALTIGLSYAAGGLWAMFLCLVIWPLHPYAPARRAVAQCYRLLAIMTGELAAGRLRETVHRQTVRTAIERARAITLQIDSGHGSEALREWLIASLSGTERLFTAMLAVEHLVQKKGFDFKARGILAAFSTLCRDAGEQARASVPDLKALARESRMLADSLSVDDGAIGDLVLMGARTLETMSDGLMRNPRLLPDGAVFPGNVRVTSAHWRHALRLSLSLVTTHLATMWLGLQYGFWALVAVVLVVQPSGYTTLIRAVERILGTIGGGVLVLIAKPFLPDAVEMLVADAICVIGAIAMRAVNYTLLVLFLTAQFILVTEMTMPTHNVAGLRILDNMLGSIVGLLCAYLIFPQVQSQDMNGLLRQAMIANLRYLASVLGRDPDIEMDRVQRQAGIALTRAEFARGTLPLLGGVSSNGKTAVAAHRLLRELRQLSGEVTLLRFDIAAGLCVGDPSIARQWKDRADALAAGEAPGPLEEELQAGQLTATIAAWERRKPADSKRAVTSSSRSAQSEIRECTT